MTTLLSASTLLVLFFIVPERLTEFRKNSLEKLPKSSLSDPTQKYSPAGSYNGLFPQPIHQKLKGFRKVSQTVQSYLTWKYDDKISVDQKPREKITVYFNGFDTYYSKQFDIGAAWRYTLKQYCPSLLPYFDYIDGNLLNSQSNWELADVYFLEFRLKNVPRRTWENSRDKPWIYFSHEPPVIATKFGKYRANFINYDLKFITKSILDSNSRRPN